MRTVLFTQRVEIAESYGERRDCADQRIADFIRSCGFLPVPVPNRGELAGELAEAFGPAGIILTGGNSLCRYGGTAPERDGMDEVLIRLAEEKRIPLYGFCRGMQSVLVYFGNELEEVKGHAGVRHPVRGKVPFREVNSYHNQACVCLKEGCGLEVTASAEDGVIEAVRHTGLPVVGTMWHPEREKPFDPADIRMVKRLFGENGSFGNL